jgi:hypothetical protein
MRAAWLAAALLGTAACGYRVAARGAPLAGGVTRVAVAPLENRTADAETGALVAAALREELARRGADGGPADGSARLEGVVEDTRAAPSVPTAQAWRLALTVSGRLVKAGTPVAEARVVREEEFLSGQDPLETEGRRRLALRRAAAAAARDLLERMEAR